MKGLFINNAEAKDSIHISGKMVYDCLTLSDNIQFDYLEISELERVVPLGYDFYFINYHPYTMAWLDTKSLRKLLGFIGTIVLEISPNDPFVLCPERDFDFYCVLDPTVSVRNKKVFPFPRPLPYNPLNILAPDHGIPVIGSFGFATKGKGFQHVVEAVNKEFERATVRINIPYGDFVPDSLKYAAFLKHICMEKAKPGIDVVVTNDFMSEEHLVKWCSENTLNCFLYDRKMPGLSATTDQAIISGRPLAVSDNDTFRHITQYIKPYPQWSLKESIEMSVPMVHKMQNDWSRVNFAKKFDQLISSKKELFNSRDKKGNVTLQDANPILTDAVENRIKKYRRKLTFQNLKSLFNDSGNSKKII